MGIDPTGDYDLLAMLPEVAGHALVKSGKLSIQINSMGNEWGIR